MGRLGIDAPILLTSSAIVLSNDTPGLVKWAARLAKVVFGSRIQICDGTNDEAEIQDAIDALPAGGGKVVLLAGTYTTEGAIILGANQGLVGQGSSSIIHYHLTLNTAIVRLNGVYGYLDKLAIKGTHFGGATGQFCVYIDANHCTVSDCYIYDSAYDGILTTNCTDIEINNNVIYNCMDDGINPSAGTERISIIDNDISGITGDGIHLAKLGTLLLSTVQGNLISGCGNGIGIYDSSYNTIAGNIISGCSNAGIIAHTGDCSHTTIENNIIYNCTGSGIQGRMPGTIIGNEIDTADKGMYVWGDDTDIIGNRISNANIGMYLVGSYCTISGNTLLNLVNHGIYFGFEAPTDSYCSVTDNIINTVTGGTNRGIALNNMSHNIIKGNIVTDVSSWGILEEANCGYNSIINNDLSELTFPLSSNSLTTEVRGNRGTTPVDDRVLTYMKNTSGGNLVAGDVICYETVPVAGDEFETSNVQGSDRIYGVLVENINDYAYGYVQVLGKTTIMRATNADGAIAIGDFLCQSSVAEEAGLAAAADMAFAIALEICDAVDCTLDALLVTPRKLS